MKTTAQRLQAARKSAADWLAKCPKATHYHDWRNNVARPFKRQPAVMRWSDDKPANHAGRALYIDSMEATGWRMTGDASDILRNAGSWRAAEECNWYADNDHDAVIKSAVLQLPARGGLARYIPATYCTDWDGATCYPLDWYDTPEEAARAAASYAQTEAEESREYYAKDRAEQDIIEAREEIHRINKEALALAREIKQQGRAFSPAICSALRGSLMEYLNDRREQFDLIAKRQADYWSAVQ
jgi:hypothetical protein